MPTEAVSELDLRIRIHDPIVVQYLREFEEPQREARLITAARIGIQALNAASGQLDAHAVQDAFREAEQRLQETLRRYFEKESGEVHRFLREMFGENGHLQSTLERYFGRDSGHVRELLRNELGPGSSFAKALDLSNRESALAKLEEALLRQLSLDHEDSAISRLKRVLDEHQRSVNDFLSWLQTRKEMVEVTPIKGKEFEKVIYPIIATLGRGFGDATADVSATTGAIPRCKTGDLEVELGKDSGLPGGKIVFECKKERGYTLRRSREELSEAKKNRGAQVGVFVFAKGYEPPEVGDFLMLDGDIYCTVEEGKPPLYLEAAYRIARASLVLRSAARQSGLNVPALRDAIARAGAELKKLADLHRRAVTAQDAVNEIVAGLEKRTKKLQEELGWIEEHLCDGRSRPAAVE